jgi:hypothetical protein
MSLNPNGTAVENVPLNGSVAFLKDTEVYITRDYWRIVVNFDFTVCEDAIAMLRSEMWEREKIAQRSSYEKTMAMLRNGTTGQEDITKRTAPLAEVQRVKMVLNSLESKLGDLKEFLPRIARRSGLINVGGQILKAATIADLDGLHTTVDTLHKEGKAMAHSLDK